MRRTSTTTPLWAWGHDRRSFATSKVFDAVRKHRYGWVMMVGVNDMCRRQARLVAWDVERFERLIHKAVQRNCPKDVVVNGLGGGAWAIVGGSGTPIRLAKRLQQACGLIDQSTLSIGWSLIPAHEPAQSVWAKVLSATEHARMQGGNRIQRDDPVWRRAQNHRFRLERDLAQALEKGALELYYQPQFRCSDQKVKGFEALLRWTHPEFGTISPAEFIPIAEQSGLMPALGAWVLKTACAEAASWDTDHTIAVNVSALQLKEQGWGKTVTQVLSDTGLAPERLELELTESVAIEHPDRARAIIQELRGQGVRVSLDDFGTGYASLGALHRFAFHRVKIDRAFVQNLEGNGSGWSIMKAIIELGHALDLTVTAEGVETQAQLEALQRHACDDIQGFLLSRPKPIAQVRAEYGLARN